MSLAFRLKGTSRCPSCTSAPSTASCEVRPGCSGLCPDGPRNPSRAGAWAICLCLLPACPHWERFQHSLNPPQCPSCLLYLGLPHTALEKPVCPSTSLSTPSRHWGGCHVPLKLSLLQAGQAPLHQTLGQCSQDTLKS